MSKVTTGSLNAVEKKYADYPTDCRSGFPRGFNSCCNRRIRPVRIGSPRRIDEEALGTSFNDLVYVGLPGSVSS